MKSALKCKMELLNGFKSLQKHVCRLGGPYYNTQNKVLGIGCRHMSLVASNAYEHNQFNTLKVSANLPNVIELCRAFSSGKVSQITSSSHKHAAERKENPEQDHFPTDRGMNIRVSIENDYLSWMRNSYIMTLGGVSMLHFDLWSAGVVAGAAALITSSMNLCVGTIGYIHNLRSLRQRQHISGFMCKMAQLWAIVHFLFWGTVLMVIFPEYRLIESEDIEENDNENESSS